MSVFKRRRTNRAGKKTADNTWTVEFPGHQSITRRLSAFTDRSASVELESQLKKLVALRMAGAGPDAELSRFLESCHGGVRDKLGEWGIIAGERAAAGKPLTMHIADWQVAMEAKGNCSRHIRNFASNLKRLSTKCRWRHLTDISPDDANDWLAEQRRAGMAAATINAFLRSARRFAIGLSRQSGSRKAR